MEVARVVSGSGMEVRGMWVEGWGAGRDEMRVVREWGTDVHPLCSMELVVIFERIVD
jgi:hypothetical protein